MTGPPKESEALKRYLKKAIELFQSFENDFKEMIAKASGSAIKCLEKTVF